MRSALVGLSAALLVVGALLFAPGAARADGPHGRYYNQGRHGYYRGGGYGYPGYYRGPRTVYRAPVYAPPVVRYGVPSIGYAPYGYSPYGYSYGYPGFSIGFQGRNFSFYYSR